MIIFLLLVLCVESLVEILVDSKFFFPLRNWLVKSSNIKGFFNPPVLFLNKLFSCGYCMSVWIAFLFAVFWDFNIIDGFLIDLFCKTLILHRSSNVLHELFSRWFGRTPFVLVFQKIDPIQTESEVTLQEVE